MLSNFFDFFKSEEECITEDDDEHQRNNLELEAGKLYKVTQDFKCTNVKNNKAISIPKETLLLCLEIFSYSDKGENVARFLYEDSTVEFTGHGCMITHLFLQETTLQKLKQNVK